jgi:hypothetical protein
LKPQFELLKEIYHILVEALEAGAAADMALKLHSPTIRPDTPLDHSEVTRTPGVSIAAARAPPLRPNASKASAVARCMASTQGLTLVHFSAQRKHNL